MTRSLAQAALALLTVVPLGAQTPVLPSDALGAFRLSCAAGGAMERVPVEGQAFTEALRLRTPANISTGSDREWSCRIRHTLSVPVAANDWLVAVFWMRAIESGQEAAQVKLNFERNAPDYRKSVASGTMVTTAWRRMQIPFRIVEAYQPGGAMLDFWVGYDPQVIELGGISVMNHGQSSTAPVPTLGFTYPGRELDSAWRAEADARIDKHRKAELSVKVVDAAGKPVENAAVKVTMKRHAFGWGSAVAASAILGGGSDNETYRAKVRELFNQVVVENDLKWPQWEQDRNRAMRLLDWMRDNNLPVRGHNMVWPGWQYLPADLRAISSNPDRLRTRIDQHILEIGQATRGRVIDWDVVNEPIPNRDLQNILGDYELVRWFQLARAADPDAKLYINEYDIETGGGRNKRKQDQYFDLIQALIERQAPLDGIGIQGHFGTDVTDPRRVYEILDRFASFKLPIKITEFDINTSDEELQADYTRDYLTVCFSHPAMDSILIWGFWEGRHWLPAAAPYRRDWSEKPHGRVWRELLFDKWWTKAEGLTNADGAYSTRAFLGDHEIEVRVGDQVATRPLQLTRENATVEFKLD